LPGHRDGLYGVAFAPDGGMIATGGDDGSIRLWDSKSGKPLEVTAEHLGRVTHLSFAAGGKEVVSAESGGLFAYDVRTGRALRRLAEGVNLRHAAFSGDGSVSAASHGPERALRAWDTATGKLRVDLPKARALDVLVAANGKSLLYAHSEGFEVSKLILWDLVANEKVAEFAPPGGADERDTRLLALSSDGLVLAMRRSEDGPILLADARTGKELLRLPAGEHPEFCAAFSPDGKLLALGNWDGSVRLHDAASGKRVAVFKGHQGHVNAVAFAADGRRLASASGDGSALVWDVTRWAR
jgi:WD40 repeat protein